MEAADDISYCIADVDDAVDKGILSIDKLHSEIVRIWESFRGKEGVDDSVVDDGYLLTISEEAMKKAKEQKFNSNHVYILTLRTTLVNGLARYAASRYVENHDLVFSGDFDASLFDGCDKYNLATETLRLLSENNVFNHAEVENLELKGYAVISGLLEIYSSLLKLSFSEFKTLAQSNRLKKAIRLKHVYSISYQVSIRTLTFRLCLIFMK